MLAAGPGTVLSHREAAALHALLPAAGATIHVTVAARRRVPGIAVHRVERLDAADATSVDGMASTTASVTRSALEDRFLSLVAEHRLPRPLMNANVDGVEVDAMWPAARLVVELDGWAFHRTRAAFQRDRDRTNELTANGWTVLRFTYADVTERPARTAARIAQAATARG